MSVTPNMNLSLPEPTVTPGPDWASQINEALEVVDDHDHSSDKGKKVTPAGLDINVDLDFQDNSLQNAYKVNLVNQSSTLTGVDNACTISFVNGNFYITNSGGTAVQVTDGTSVVNTTVIPPSPLMPAGTMLDYAGITVPPGFLAADGSAVSRSTYADLFAAIGTAWGAGDGTTTFNLPDASGRASIGSGTYNDSGTGGSVTRSLGQTLGASVHTLTVPQLASHTHIQNPHSHVFSIPGSIGAGLGSGPYNLVESTYPLTQALATNNTTATNQNAGGSEPHNNMQPSMVINKIIKY